MRCTTPAVLKPRLSWMAGWMLPLPETVDWTTPCWAVTMRLCTVADCEGAPTTRKAATIAPAQRAPSAYTSQDALGRSVIYLARIIARARKRQRRKAASGDKFG